MICMNANTDSNDSAVNYSSMSLSSSPVNSLAIKQLLESPIINSSSQLNQKSVERSGDSDTDQDMSDQKDDILAPESPETERTDMDEILAPESPEGTPNGSQEAIFSLDMLEVPNTQQFSVSTEDDSNDTNQTNGRNCLRRQSSVCVSAINTNITSSPRALAILKNAIKTSNKFCDKLSHCSEESTQTSDNNRNGFELNTINGVNSPPNHKLLRNSPFSRGSALLKAAKERLERQESERSPKIRFFSNDSTSFDRRLTSILRKHELQSSPTSSSEPKAKKKRVLFAEPVVSSELEFKSISPQSSEESISEVFKQSVERELEELNEKKRNNLVHQNSTFDKEFDANYHNDSDVDSDNESDNTPLYTEAQYLSHSEPFDEPTCGQRFNTSNEDQFVDSQEILYSSRSLEEDRTECDPMCSQAFPDRTPSQDLDDEHRTSVGIQTEDEDDIIVNVPIRLGLLKELYNLFGTLIQQYSDS